MADMAIRIFEIRSYLEIRPYIQSFRIGLISVESLSPFLFRFNFDGGRNVFSDFDLNFGGHSWTWIEAMKGIQEQMVSALAFKQDHFIKTVGTWTYIITDIIDWQYQFSCFRILVSQLCMCYFLPVLVLKAIGISFLLKLILFDAQRHDFGGMHQSWRFW